MNPLLAPLTKVAFPELAEAMKSRADKITIEWDAAVRHALPRMDRETFDGLKDSVPRIVSAIADALACSEPWEIKKLVEQAPVEVRVGFRKNYELIDVMQENRLLRATIVLNTEDELKRRMSVAEAAALHVTIDVMLQRVVVALVEQQEVKLRAAAEAELKYLAFLSHDLNNNLGSVTLMLSLLRQQLTAASPDRSGAVETLDDAQQSIRDTIGGMQRLLHRERLRASSEQPRSGPVDFHSLADAVVAQAAGDAERKGLRLMVDVRPGALSCHERELVRLVLQNLVGNAIKFSSTGTVSISAAHHGGGEGQWSLSVTDQGPGIAPEKLDSIFEAFRRGEVHGQDGVGLGLAIASHAAKLLGARLTVESKIGKGSTFTLALPRGGQSTEPLAASEAQPRPLSVWIDRRQTVSAP
jgi:signal transduction histidine kinase